MADGDSLRRRRGRCRLPIFTPEQLEDIRAWYRLLNSVPSAADMAEKYGVCAQTIRMIGRGYLYKKSRADQSG